ncbi:E3 ubiquitin-protein ligase TRIM71-like [Ptychodera flava]|uniref:E3 ubiquitin-protein ligase TRIM71-like n=1 Tax=Ptychodera flava TaxID=63121 RepID=UPI00396AB08A
MLQQIRPADDSEFTQVENVNLLSDDEITEKNEDLEAKVNKLTISGWMTRSQNRDKGRRRKNLQTVIVEGDRVEELKLNTIFSKFVGVKTEARNLEINHPEMVKKTDKLSAYADNIVREAEIPEETKEVYLDVRRVEEGHPVKGSVLEVFGSGSMPGQFSGARGIYIKKNGQWVICDYYNHRVQVIDPIQLCCDLILQFHAFPKSFDPWNVTVDEDNDQYFMSDLGNGQVVVSSGQSKILNCFGRKEGIDPRGIGLSPDGFIFIGDLNGYVRKYNKSGEHIARTEEGQVSEPLDLIVNKKCIFVSDLGRNCVHVLNHQMQSIRDIGKGHLEGPEGLCFDHQQDGIYVCDYNGDRVVHFNCDGEFLSYKGQGQLEYPLYIALCKDNPYRLVVTQGDCVKLLYI